MRISWLTWTWPTFILLSTLAVALITFLFPGIGARPVVIMCFLFVIPGMTVVRFFRLNELATEWMFALVLSFAIDAFVAGIMLYAGQWSPNNIFSFLLGFCFSGAIAQLAIVRPDAGAREPLPSPLENEVTIDLTKFSSLEDELTVDLASIDLTKLSSLEDDMTIDLASVEDPEDTKERTAVLRKPHKLHREDTEEKTVVLDKPELLGKEA